MRLRLGILSRRLGLATVFVLLVFILLISLHKSELFHTQALPPTEALVLGRLADRCNAVLKQIESVTDYDNNNPQDIIDRVQDLRLYGHCYLRNKFTPDNPEDLNRIEGLLFPMLRFSPSQTLKDSKGKGIILSIGDTGLTDLQGLIRVLDLLNNQLEIEIYHKNDTRIDMLNDIDFGSQKVKIINARSLIPDIHYHRYRRFVNKWIPLLLSSFEEVIFMDTDVVPFINPVEFFQTSKYIQTGSYFFKDRGLNDRINSRDVSLYRNLLPSNEECKLFNMKEPNRELFNTDKHLMESGVVVLNRTKYMPGLLIAASLQLWNRTSEPLWGDKELFWMGQLISGETGFAFGHYNAGALGHVERIERGNYTCSIQLAHFDDSLNLLWINGGLRKCKLGSWKKDWKNHEFLRDKYNDVKQMKSDFLSPLNANGVVIPPKVDLTWKGWFSKPKAGFLKDEKLGCSGYTWCAYDTIENPGITLMFNAQQQAHYDTLKKTWWIDINGLV